ncbi:MAG: D-alanine--D-alanine ligase, partial [Planctomycetia bacterium]|nr:D-alanine--D-alanine ligase [Planctomycetia bacterium]
MPDQKTRIAVITGGNVAEREVSLKSAATVAKHLDSSKYEVFVIELNGTVFSEQKSGARVDLNDFSVPLDGTRVSFDLAYLMLHGHPAEDGRIQGYLELLGIPYTGCDVFVSALTFDKQACKDYLRSYGIPMAPSTVVFKGKGYDPSELLGMGLPLFVKPNKNGSSFGAGMAKDQKEFDAAMAEAFRYDDEVVVEEYLQGT